MASETERILKDTLDKLQAVDREREDAASRLLVSWIAKSCAITDTVSPRNVKGYKRTIHNAKVFAQLLDIEWKDIYVPEYVMECIMLEEDNNG